MTQELIKLQVNQEAREAAAKKTMEDSSVEMEIVALTPEMAKAFLERRHANQRTISVDRVKRYAEDMLRGDWEVTYDPIRFDEDGYLFDGQHRCAAVVKSGVTLPSIVIVHNMAKETFGVIDQGQKRTPLQSFIMQGYGTANNDIMGTLRALFWTPESVSKAEQMSVPQLTEAFEKYRQALEFVCKPYGPKKDAVMYPAARAVVARAYLTGLYQFEQLAEFLTALDTGVMKYATDKPAIQLRNAYQANKAKLKDRAVKQRLFLMSVTALNHFVHGKTVDQLRPASKQMFQVDGLPN